MGSSPGLRTDPEGLFYPLILNTTTTIITHNSDVNTTTPSTTTTTTTETSLLDTSLVAREVLAAILVVVMVVGVGGNGLLCVLVYRKAAMRSAINLMVAQLALSDVLLACGVMPLTLADLFLPLTLTLTWSRWLCAVEGFCLEVLVTLNLCLVLAVSLDRYLIIIHRKEKLNVQRSRVVIAVAWGFSLLCAAPPLFGWGCFVSFSSQRLCVRFMTRRTSDLSYVVISSLVTKFLPMSAILYSYARIISTVRKKNTKVHHLAVDVSATQSSGLAYPRTAVFPVSVDLAVREVSNTASSCAAIAVPCLHCTHCPDFCKASSLMSSSEATSLSYSSVSFVSRNSTVHLHCVDRLPCCQHLSLSASTVPTKCSSDCSSLKVTEESVSGALFGTQHSTCTFSSTHCSCREISSRCLLFHSHAGMNREPVEPCREVCCCCCCGGRGRRCVGERMGEQHRPPPSLSSPSGFSFRANGVRRTAGSRRQVVDMSFKTRAFNTIFILSLLFCLCWSPFLTASLLTALNSSSSSSSSFSSSSSSFSSFSSSFSSSSSSSFSSSSSSSFSSSSSSSSSSYSSGSVRSSPSSFPSSTSPPLSSSSCSSLPYDSSSSSYLPHTSSSAPSSSSSPSPPPPPSSPSSSPLQLLSVLLWLGFLKSALNPVVYLLRIRKFREAFRVAVLMPRGCCCPEGADGCDPCPRRWADALGKRRVNPRALYQC
ncbi:hypothetical protein ACOMHN_059588 [Nucella lapillus]